MLWVIIHPRLKGAEKNKMLRLLCLSSQVCCALEDMRNVFSSWLFQRWGARNPTPVEWTSWAALLSTPNSKTEHIISLNFTMHYTRKKVIKTVANFLLLLRTLLLSYISLRYFLVVHFTQHWWRKASELYPSIQTTVTTWTGGWLWMSQILHRSYSGLLIPYN